MCRLTLITSLAIALILTACKRQEARVATPYEAGPPLVCCVNYPIYYFASVMAGDAADVRFPPPADVDPAFWRPTAADIRLFQQADLILLNGAGYAKWIPTAALPESRLVDTCASVSDRLIEIEAATTHSHGLGGEHDHAGIAFTTWLDLEIAIVQADSVRNALVDLLPDQQEAINRAFAQLRTDLRAVHDRLLACARSDLPLLASHPVYQYFARAYGLDVRALLLEPDEMPGDETWAQIEAMIADRPAPWILWEGEPLPEVARRLRELAVEGIVIDPCGHRPERGDFLSVMVANGEAMEHVFGSPDRGG